MEHCPLGVLTNIKAIKVMDFDEIFASELSEQGGILLAQQMHQSNWNMALMPTLQHYTDAVEILKHIPAEGHPLDNFYVNYIANSELNAMAFEKSEIDFVAIYPNLILLVEDILWGVWASPSIFPKYGIPSNTTTNNLDIALYLRRKPILLPSWGDLRTNDLERWKLCRQLARIANLFIFYHEISHIRRGHLLVPSLRLQTNCVKLYEYPPKPYSHYLNAETLQALEIDADEGATEFLLDEILTYSTFFLKDYSFSEKIAFWLFSIGILFKILDKDTISVAYRKYSSHPPAYVRLFNVIYCGEVWIRRFYKNQHSEYLHGLELGTTELLKVTYELQFKTISETITDPLQESVKVRKNLLGMEKVGLTDLMYQRTRQIVRRNLQAFSNNTLNQGGKMTYDEIEYLLSAPNEALYGMLSIEVSKTKLGLKEPNIQETIEWFSRKRNEIQGLICNSVTVKVYLSSQRVTDRVMLVAAIADLISSQLTGAAAITVAVLIVREGLQSICEDQNIKTDSN